MKRIFTYYFTFFLLLFPALLTAQSLEFYLSNKLKFIKSNDTIPYPFMGGFVAPQFSTIDLNGDAIKDLIVHDRSGNKLLTFLNDGNNGQSQYIYAPQFEPLFPALGNWVLLRDYNCDGLEDIFTATESSGIAVYKNISSSGQLKFKHISGELRDNTDVNMYVLILDMPVIDDIDGDGDLDVMTFGVLGGYAEYYQNRRVEDGLHCDSLIFKFVDYCWGSFVEGGLSNQIFLGQTGCAKYYSKNAAHSGSTLLTFDADQDGDKELIIGDVDYPTFNYLKNGKKENSWPWDTVTSWSPNYPSSKPVYIDKFPAGFYEDVDNDGIKDLIATSNEAATASNLDQIWWYKNKGLNNAPDFEFRDSNFMQDQTIDFGSGSSPRFFDVDGDGDLDLLVTHRGNYRLTLNNKDRVALFTNIGTNTSPAYKLTNEDIFGFADDSIAGLRLSFGDLDNDGLTDLVCGKANGQLSLYKNTGSAGNPAFTLVNGNFGSIDAGAYAAPALFDLNKDNLLDLIVGNSAGILKYHINKGTSNTPSFNAVPDIDSLGKILVNAFFWSPVYDSAWNVIDSTKSYEFEGFADPVLADLDNDGTPELIVGSKSGKVFIYRVNQQSPDSIFPEVIDYYQPPVAMAKRTVDFGGRTSPACLDVNNDGRPDILIGNSRGGLHYLSSKFEPLDSLQPTSSGKILPVGIVSLYPNPAVNQLNIQFDHSIKSIGIQVFDLTGRMVLNRYYQELSGRVIDIPVDGFANGAYFIRLDAPGYAPSSYKFLVMH